MTLVVCGSGTDVGKTFVACRLIERLRGDGARVEVRKPVASGFDPARVEESDAVLLLRAAGLALTAIDDVNPWRFRASTAPDAAARAEGVRLSLAKIVAFCARPAADVLVVETAGGVMSPLCEDATMLDLVERLGAPAILVAGSYLGGVSHALCAHLALRSRGVAVRAVVVNRGSEEDAEPFRRFLPGVNVVALAEAARCDAAAIGALASWTLDRDAAISSR